MTEVDAQRSTVLPATVLPAAIARLRAAGVNDAPRDARILLAHAMGIAPDRLVLVARDPLPEGAGARFAALIAARVLRQPVSQLTGRRDFYGRPFKVTPDVLDPRPETETLIEVALAAPFARVLDLGTGSGAILVTLLAERGAARGVGVDVSAAALAVAAENAAALGVAGRAVFLLSDWYAADRLRGARFDLIVANPPYIAAAEMAGLAPEVRDWEPHLALTPGGDGLDAVRRIAAGAGAHLHPGGRIAIEIGPTQGAAALEILRAAEFQAGRVIRDLDGRARIVAACWQGGHSG
jgi:release factor glutamine methyltransferase